MGASGTGSLLGRDNESDKPSGQRGFNDPGESFLQMGESPFLYVHWLFLLDGHKHNKNKEQRTSVQKVEWTPGSGDMDTKVSLA